MADAFFRVVYLLDDHTLPYYTEIQIMERYIMAASRMVQARVPSDIQDIANQVIKGIWSDGKRCGARADDPHCARQEHSFRTVPTQ